MSADHSVVHGNVNLSADTPELAKYDSLYTGDCLGLLEGQGSSIITMPCSLGTPSYIPLNLNNGKHPFPGLSQSSEEEPAIVKASTNPCIGLQAAQPESNMKNHRARVSPCMGKRLCLACRQPNLSFGCWLPAGEGAE